MAIATRHPYVQLKKLRDQTIVITGASSGIGLATARRAAQRGACIVLAARDEDALRRLHDELRATGARTAYAVADVGKEADVAGIAEVALKAFGGFDTWFNNAGVTIYGTLTELSMADQRRLFETNFWGVVHGSRIAVEHLRRRGGALINMGSVTADVAIPLQGIYSASKHAVKAYTDALRMELEREGAPIAVTLVKPSSIDTPYCRHAKNYMAFKPRNPPPLYAPAVVAEAVLHCAENPRRDVVVGGSGRLAAAFGVNAPRVSDAMMKRALFDMQLTDESADRGHGGNLETPAGGLEERAGDAHAAESSLYTTAALRHRPSNLLADGAAMLAGVAWRTLHRVRGLR